LFTGLPATGAIARTATNVRAGGKTPVAGIVHVDLSRCGAAPGSHLRGLSLEDQGAFPSQG